jgi:uncharacterized damage-inducible protein DinB
VIKGEEDQSMINKDGLLTLYEYNAYANHLVLAEMAKMSDAEFVRQISPSHGCVRDLFVHILLVQSGYLSYCLKQPSVQPPLPAFTDVRDYCLRLDVKTNSFIDSCSDDDLTQNLEINLRNHPFRFPVWQMLLQPVVHAIHHRGELSIGMTGLGYPLPTLDIVIPFAEQSGQPWPWK